MEYSMYCPPNELKRSKKIPFGREVNARVMKYPNHITSKAAVRAFGVGCYMPLRYFARNTFTLFGCPKVVLGKTSYLEVLAFTFILL